MRTPTSAGAPLPQDQWRRLSEDQEDMELRYHRFIQRMTVEALASFPDTSGM